jgi:hypothetical protein
MDHDQLNVFCSLQKELCLRRQLEQPADAAPLVMVMVRSQTCYKPRRAKMWNKVRRLKELQQRLCNYQLLVEVI